MNGILIVLLILLAIYAFGFTKPKTKGVVESRTLLRRIGPTGPPRTSPAWTIQRLSTKVAFLVSRERLLLQAERVR